MIENNKTAILLGASGLIGSFLLDILLKSESYDKVIIFVRKYIEKIHSKLVQQVIDFDDVESYKDLVVGDDLFCCLGTTIKQAGSQSAFRQVDFEYSVNFATIAKASGVKQLLIVTSIGANPKSSAFYLRIKGECESAVKKIGLDSISIFRPASLVGKRKVERLSERISLPILKVLSILFFGKLRKYKPISASQVAKAMYMIAQNPRSGCAVYESDAIQSF